MDKHDEKIMEMYINAFCSNRAKGNESFDDCEEFAKRAIKSFQEQFPRENYEKKDFIPKTNTTITSEKAGDLLKKDILDVQELMFKPRRYKGMIVDGKLIPKTTIPIEKLLTLVISSDLKDWNKPNVLQNHIDAKDIDLIISTVRKAFFYQKVKKVYLPNSQCSITINIPNKRQMEELSEIIPDFKIFKQVIDPIKAKQSKITIIKEISISARYDNWLLDETTKTLVMDQICEIQVNHPRMKSLLTGLESKLNQVLETYILVFKDWASLMLGIYKAYLSNTTTDVEISTPCTTVPDAIITVKPLPKQMVDTFKKLSFFKHETFIKDSSIKFICYDSKNKINLKDEKGDLLKFDICIEAFQYILINYPNSTDIKIHIIKEEPI